MIENLEDNMIIVTPLSSKLELLTRMHQGSQFYSIKFMTKEEFFQAYFFSYDERALWYLQEKYQYHLDICKLYLKNLYFIEEKSYRNEKLKKLQALKKELEEAGLLFRKPQFLEFIKNKKIVVYQYDTLEKYEKKVLDQLGATYFTDDICYPLPKVIKKAKSMEEELVYLAVSIRKLIRRGVLLSHIHIAHVTDDYFYCMKRIFSYFQIPLQPFSKYPFYGTVGVSRYLKTGEIDLNDPSSFNLQLLQIINSVSYLEEGESKRNIIIDKLKHTMIKEEQLEEAVSICEISDTFTEDDYVFVIGVNQDLFPSFFKDDDFLSDYEKEEVDLYKTDEKNEFLKEKTKKLLQRIPHLFLSYKLESSFQTFMKSTFIEELGIIDEDVVNDDYHYSNSYNRLLLAEGLDDYYKYGTIRPFLFPLYATYPEIPYCTYDASFTGVKEAQLKEYLQASLKLSYTHLQNYYLCGFKYYIQHILRLDPFSSTFASKVGTMFHEALKYMYCDDFDLDYFMVKFIEQGEYSAKEQFFLRLLKEDLKKTISIIYEQKEYTKFSNQYLEHLLQVKLPDPCFSVVLKGTIDKIMYYSNIEDTYYAVIDYKSGSFDTNLKKMQFGLNMQLPIYLYLIEKSRLFPNAIFTGFYYQKLLLPKKTYGKEKEVLKLEGYSCDNPSILEKFDNSYLKSDIIKGLAVKQSGEFYASSKLLNGEEIEKILALVEEKVLLAKEHILKGDFAINPKYLEKENISCKYCKYRDLCFVKEKDLVYLSFQEEI